MRSRTELFTIRQLVSSLIPMGGNELGIYMDSQDYCYATLT